MKRFVTSKFNERNINHLFLNKNCQRQSKRLRSNYAHAEYITRLLECLTWVHILRIVRSYLYFMIFSRCWVNEFLEWTSDEAPESEAIKHQFRLVSRPEEFSGTQELNILNLLFKIFNISFFHKLNETLKNWNRMLN